MPCYCGTRRTGSHIALSSQLNGCYNAEATLLALPSGALQHPVRGAQCRPRPHLLARVHRVRRGLQPAARHCLPVRHSAFRRHHRAGQQATAGHRPVPQPQEPPAVRVLLVLSDEFYRYSARRDIGLPPTRDRVLPHRCGACRMDICADGFHGQRCIHNSAFTKLRHDGFEALLHDIIRDGVGLAYRQQHGLPAAERTVPDLLIYLDNQAFLCDVTVADTLADGNLLHSKLGPGRLAERKAEKKESKYRRVATELQAVHLPFAVETLYGTGQSSRRTAIHNRQG